MPQYCLVKHHIVSSVIDGPDPGNDPDTVPVSGDVTFYPALDYGDSVVVTSGAGKTSYVLAPISARIVGGKISVNGEDGVKLFAGGPDTNPERIRYRAKFTDLNIAGGKSLSLKDVLFEAIPGGEISLSMVQPVPGAPYPGYSMQVEDALLKIDTSKETALTEISSERASSLASVNSAVQTRLESMDPMVWVHHGIDTPALAGFPGARVDDVIRRVSDEQEWRVDEGKLTPITNPLALRRDTSVGTRIFAGTTMIYGDTGRRSVPELTKSLTFPTPSLYGMYIRRVGNTVTLEGRGKWIAGQWLTETLPAGFRPIHGDYLSVRGFASVDGTARTFGNGGTLNQLNFSTPFPAAESDVAIKGSWHTHDPWPTILPGLPI